MKRRPKTPIKRNIINLNELTKFLRLIIRSYPEFRIYIEHNVRNYMLREGLFRHLKETDKLTRKERSLIKEKAGKYHVLYLGKDVQIEIEHALDYLTEINAVNDQNFGFSRALKETKLRDKKRILAKIEEPGITELIHQFSDGTYIVKLIDKQAYKNEAWVMRNCVDTYFGSISEIYSYRKLNEKRSIASIEMELGRAIQILGFSNSIIEGEIEERLCQTLNSKSPILMMERKVREVTEDLRIDDVLFNGLIFILVGLVFWSVYFIFKALF